MRSFYKLKILSSNLLSLFEISLLFSEMGQITCFCLPARRKRFTLLKSPFVNKKAKENIQVVENVRVYYIYLSKVDLRKKLLKMPKDVFISIVKLS